ncbi:MAG: hypothetical protein JO314_06630 [Acidobacteria bacterium]|nr:hypothetical protein [Acidobacteriota bacterium]
MKSAKLFVVLLAIFAGTMAASGQTPSPTPLSPEKQAKRDATRESLRKVLMNLPSGIPITFRQSDKQPYNFVGTYNTNLKNGDLYEIVIGVTPDETISFRVYPHYNKSYINLDKVRNSAGLMRQIMVFNDHNFLFWGADDTGDIFAGYTITLESGFPDEAVRIILWSVAPLDGFVGQMRPNIDGSSKAP